MEDDLHIKTTKNSDDYSPIAGFFLFISIVLNVMILMAFICCRDGDALERIDAMERIRFVFFFSFIFFLFCAVPLSVHANKQGGSKLCRIYAVSFATCIVSVIPLAVLFDSVYAVMVLFILSNVSGYAVVPFLRRKREFIFYLIAQSLSLCSFFVSAYIAISAAIAC